MKSRLFWKVLISFWLTFFFAVPAVWFPVTVVFGERMALSEPDILIEQSGQQVQPRAGDPAVVEGLGIFVEPTRNPRAYARFWWELLIVGGITGLAFSVAVAHYLARPVSVLRSGFTRLANGDFEVKLADKLGSRRDELADLAREFDKMALRLEALMTARDKVLHDLSHEIRSPLSRLLIALGLIQQQPGRAVELSSRMEREIARLTLMVEEVLTLARAESNAVRLDSYYDPLEVAKAVVEDARFEAGAAALSIDLCLPERELQIAVQGTAPLLAMALENVIRNAIKYSPTGSRIKINAVLIECSEPTLEIVVRDDGPGVQTGSLSAIFEPFSGTDRQGFGLGLSIARRAILAQGGTIFAANNQPSGLLVTVLLPVVFRGED